MLGDALRSLLLGRNQEEWEIMLPELMRAYQSTPHSSTQETPSLLVLGRETRVPEHLTYHVPALEFSVHEYVGKWVESMRKAHDALREKQWTVRTEDSEEPPLYREGDWMWMVSYCRRRGQSAKLQPKFVGPYCVVEVLPNHTYRVERSGQISVQNEQRLKPYYGSPEAAGQAPPLLRPARQPISRRRRNRPRDCEIFIRDPEEVDNSLRPQPQNPPSVPPTPDPLPRPTQIEDPSPPPDNPGPVTPPGNLEEVPPIYNTPDQPDTSASNTLERARRDRKPPKYLADYHVGRLTGPQLSSCSPSTGKDSKPRMQSSPESAGQLQVQQLANQPRHVVDGHPPSVDPSGQWCPRPMDDLDPTQGSDLDERIQALSCHLDQCTREIESLIRRIQ